MVFRNSASKVWIKCVSARPVSVWPTDPYFTPSLISDPNLRPNQTISCWTWEQNILKNNSKFVCFNLNFDERLVNIIMTFKPSDEPLFDLNIKQTYGCHRFQKSICISQTPDIVQIIRQQMQYRLNITRAEIAREYMPTTNIDLDAFTSAFTSFQLTKLIQNKHFCVSFRCVSKSLVTLRIDAIVLRRSQPLM